MPLPYNYIVMQRYVLPDAREAEIARRLFGGGWRVRSDIRFASQAHVDEFRQAMGEPYIRPHIQRHYEITPLPLPG